MVYKPRIMDGILKEIQKAKEKNMQVEKIVLSNEEWEQLSLETSLIHSYSAHSTKSGKPLSGTLYGVVVEREPLSPKTTVVVASTWKEAKTVFKARVLRSVGVKEADHTSGIIRFEDGDKEVYVSTTNSHTLRGYCVDEVFFLNGVSDEEKEKVKQHYKSAMFVDA